MIGLGIDTGGTCTDAVIYDLAQNTVLASAKTPTTKEDLKTGIRNVLDRLPQDLLNSCQTLALSTTLATNACVEGKWGNGKLILIGLDRNTFESSWHKYGIPASDDIYLLECRLTPSPDNCAEPDWDAFRKDMKEFVRGCDLRQHRSAFRKRIPRAAMSSTPPISSVKSPIFLSYWDTTSSLTGISSAGAPGLFSTPG